MIIDTRISGIPCQVKVTHFHHQAPWRGSVYSCPSDVDWYGYTEIDFEVLDRKGYKAPWLEKKMTDKDTQEIAKPTKVGTITDVRKESHHHSSPEACWR